MISEDRLFKILISPRISEKSSILKEKNNIIVFKVMCNAKKIEIKDAVQKLLNVEVSAINTILVKGKKKHKGKQVINHKNWKKAYITIKQGSNIDSLSNTD